MRPFSFSPFWPLRRDGWLNGGPGPEIAARFPWEVVSGGIYAELFFFCSRGPSYGFWHLGNRWQKPRMKSNVRPVRPMPALGLLQAAALIITTDVGSAHPDRKIPPPPAQIIRSPRTPLCPVSARPPPRRQSPLRFFFSFFLVFSPRPGNWFRTKALSPGNPDLVYNEPPFIPPGARAHENPHPAKTAFGLGNELKGPAQRPFWWGDPPLLD